MTLNFNPLRARVMTYTRKNQGKMSVSSKSTMKTNRHTDNQTDMQTNKQTDSGMTGRASCNDVSLQVVVACVPGSCGRQVVS